MTWNFLRPKSRGFVLFAGPALVLSLSIASADAQKAEPCIAGSWELTGALAHTGAAIKMGIEAAVDELNEAGGVLGQKLRLLAYDDQGEPSRAVDNTRRIGERDNCIVMIGGYRTPNALAIRTVLSEIGQPWMGVISAGTKVVEWESGTNEWMFRVSMKDRWVDSWSTMRFSVARPRRSDSVRGDRLGSGRWSMSRRPSKAWRSSAGNLQHADQDMSAQLIRLRDAGADALVFWGVDREADAILRSMDRIGYKPAIISAWGIGVQLGKTAGKLTDGVLVAGTYAWTGELSPRAQKVWERIKAANKLQQPSELVLPSGTANAYDSVFVIAEALKIAGAYDKKKLRDALFKVKYEGIVAKYDPAFENTPERHDAILPSYYKLLAYHNGILLPVEQTPYAAKF